MAMDCCTGDSGYADEFSRDYARSTARRYQRRGLPGPAARMVDFVRPRGLAGASVLEIGGGVGSLCIERLRRGAATATNLDLSPNYEDARALAGQYGVADRLELRRLDIARAPDEVSPADVVVLNKVVCCYPDYAALLSAASGHARSLLVLSYPTATPVSRLSVALGNWSNAVRGRAFRAYLHDRRAMTGVIERGGLRLVMEHHGPLWSVAGFERRGA